jgi:hypothetical protein
VAPRRNKLETVDFTALGIDAAPLPQFVAPTEVVGAIRATGHDSTGLIPEPGAPAPRGPVTKPGAAPPAPPDALKKFFSGVGM